MYTHDKENTPDPDQMPPNPKKRAKPTQHTRRPPNPSTVLSPKSSNSQNLQSNATRPQLPSPQKFYFSRPTSPLKPSTTQQISPAKSAAVAATANLADLIGGGPNITRSKSIKGRQAQRPTKAFKETSKKGKVEPRSEELDTRVVSTSSNISMASSATTIIQKDAKSTRLATKAEAPRARKGNKGTKGIKAAEKPMTMTEAPLAGRRVLRTRA